MPNIYLSPSTQEYNDYINGGTEEEIMNQIADAMVPYLLTNGINFSRNTPDMAATTSIEASNRGNYDLHVALHSNASPPNLVGVLQGTDIYYHPRSVEGEKASIIIADNFKNIYPYPEKVDVISTTSLGEVVRVKAPSVFIEVAYHDNEEDADWIKNNIDEIAKTITLGLTEYFGIPFIQPVPIRQGEVTISEGLLNVHEYPNVTSDVIMQLPNATNVLILGDWNEWYVINVGSKSGYVVKEYITIY